MNGVSGVGAGSGYQGSTVTGSGAAMGKDDFLQLLVTQLTNQDPLNPMDNQAFSSQLAQFSTLEQMANMNATLESGLQADEALAGALQSGLAADLVGRRVTVVSDQVELADGAAELRWEADGDPASVRLELVSGLGVTVRSFDAEDVASGLQAWNGRDDSGRALPDAVYTLRVTALDAEGGELAARALWRGRVESVRYRMGEAWLASGELEFALGNVSEVALDEPEGGSAGPGASRAARMDDSGIDW